MSFLKGDKIKQVTDISKAIAQIDTFTDKDINKELVKFAKQTISNPILKILLGNAMNYRKAFFLNDQGKVFDLDELISAIQKRRKDNVDKFINMLDEDPENVNATFNREFNMDAVDIALYVMKTMKSEIISIKSKNI